MTGRPDPTQRSANRILVRMRSDQPRPVQVPGGSVPPPGPGSVTGPTAPVPTSSHGRGRPDADRTVDESGARVPPLTHLDPAYVQQGRTPVGRLPAAERTAIYTEQISRLIDEYAPGARTDWLFSRSTTPVAMEDSMSPYATYRQRAPNRDLFAWFEVEVPSGETGALLKQLWSSKVVAEAYAAPGVYEPPAEGDLQGYRKRDIGVNATDVVGLAGGLGQGVRLADVEYGWNSHPELPATDLLGLNADVFREHGTQTLGVIAAQQQAGGPDTSCIGIAAQLDRILLVGQGLQTATGIVNDLYNALTRLLTTDQLSEGDVVVLEAQTAWWTKSGAVWVMTPNLPAEAEPLVFDLVRALVARGLVVVAAAGNNGTIDLGRTQFREQVSSGAPGDGVFDRGTGSGAILVGATARPEKNKPIRRLAGTCFGAPVDCWAWGESVYTCAATTTSGYTDAFGGTSSAAAIVGGTVAVAQALQLQRRGARKTPAELREWMKDPKRGVKVLDLAPSRISVGSMPDLAKIAGLL